MQTSPFTPENGVTINPDGGITVDETFAAVGVEDVYCAGDIARFPLWLAGGALTRIEHWVLSIWPVFRLYFSLSQCTVVQVVAQQQGKVAAKNMNGIPTPYRVRLTCHLSRKLFTSTLAPIGCAVLLDDGLR